jgi:anaerobic selenocysteine-containing dehydrogenase
MTHSKRSICRLCTNYCGVKVDVEGNRLLRVIGDDENPVYQGYTCPKGRAHAALYEHPERLLQPLKQLADGSRVEVSLDQALDEIAAKFAGIVDVHGPRSLALYFGTFAFLDHPANVSFIDGFMTAVGSKMLFNSSSLDQPGKLLAKGFLGTWLAPSRDASSPEVVLFVGANPLVSHIGPVGVPKDVYGRAPKGIIVIDPRRTETASKARLYLQPWPGTDYAILAGIIRFILAEGLADREFISDNVTGVDELRTAVEPFTPERVSELAGVAAADVVAAARMYGSARSGYAFAGTGANMTGWGTLVEYLIAVLHTICGHWMREGEVVANDAPIMPRYATTAKAQAIPPYPAYDFGEPLRVRGFSETLAGYQAAALPDEILMPGEGQVRALLCTGGNPAGSLPSHLKAVEALRSLEAFVTVDVQMSATARLADYVIPAKLPYEMPGSTLYQDFATMYAPGLGCMQPYAQYTDALVDPPPGSSVVSQWEFIYLLAQRMGLKLEIFPGFGSGIPGGRATVIDMNQIPTEEQIFDIVHAGSRVSWREVRDAQMGLWPQTCRVVEPKDPGWTGRLDVGNQEMLAELSAATGRPTVDAQYPLHLVSRRMAKVMNTPTPARPPKTPAYNWLNVHPEDLARHGLASEDIAEIVSAESAVTCVVKADDTMRPGVVSMTHMFGGLPNDHDVIRDGSSVNQLTSDDDVYDRFSGQPRMSNVPVRLRTCFASGESRQSVDSK